MSKYTHTDFDKLDNSSQLQLDKIVFGYIVTDEEGNRIDPRNVVIIDDSELRMYECKVFWN